MTPSSTPIIGGAPAWDPLGGSSNTCYGDGCGYTDWIHSTYNIADAGNYYLLFGVTNWLDFQFDSGMAISGATVGGTPIVCPDDTNPLCDLSDDDDDDDDVVDPGPTPVPEPSIIALFAAGLLGIGFARRRMRS